MKTHRLDSHNNNSHMHSSLDKINSNPSVASIHPITTTIFWVIYLATTSHGNSNNNHSNSSLLDWHHRCCCCRRMTRRSLNLYIICFRLFSNPKSSHPNRIINPLKLIVTVNRLSEETQDKSIQIQSHHKISLLRRRYNNLNNNNSKVI